MFAFRKNSSPHDRCMHTQCLPHLNWILAGVHSGFPCFLFFIGVKLIRFHKLGIPFQCTEVRGWFLLDCVLLLHVTLPFALPLFICFGFSLRCSLWVVPGFQLPLFGLRTCVNTSMDSVSRLVACSCPEQTQTKFVVLKLETYYGMTGCQVESENGTSLVGLRNHLRIFHHFFDALCAGMRVGWIWIYILHGSSGQLG